MLSNHYKIQIKKGVLSELTKEMILFIILFTIISLLFPINFQKFDIMLIGDFIKGRIGSETLIITTLTLILILSWSILLSLRIIIRYLYLKSIKYHFSENNFILSGGIFSRFERYIPYSKIQHVIIRESFWQRIFKLSSISIQTARESIYSQEEVIIPHLNKEDAKKLKEYIISVSNKNYKPIAGI